MVEISLSNHVQGAAAQSHRPTKESIARELHAPYAEVEHLYAQELERLAPQARITQFLGVIVGKRVRLRLRQRRRQPG